jgi:hypothetical protein
MKKKQATLKKINNFISYSLYGKSYFPYTRQICDFTEFAGQIPKMLGKMLCIFPSQADLERAGCNPANRKLFFDFFEKVFSLRGMRVC